MEINNIINGIEGFLEADEGSFLYESARRCTGSGVIVEIGSWKGKSTTCLALGSKNGNNLKVYAIDPHTGSLELRKMYGEVWTYDIFMENLKKANVVDIVVPIVKTAEEEAKTFREPIELIFIDGSHEYEDVKKDFELWFPKVIFGGIMAFHDAAHSHRTGPQDIVNEFVYNSTNFTGVGIIGSIVYATKV